MPYSCNYAIIDKKSAFTVGLELEVRLVESDTMKPANKSTYLFENIPPNLKENIHKELLQSMIEIVTPVCNSSTEAADFVMNTLHRLADTGKKENISLAALATHPFERKEDNLRFEDPRYDAFAEELQIVLKNFLISGLHMHVAVPSVEAAINAYNLTIKYMPIFLALSASSPFHLGEDTGLQSYRSEIFERLPRAGIPQHFEKYEDYCGLMMMLYRNGVIKSAKDVWWDVRIHQQFGTVELRICDAFYDRERLRLLALFYRGLIRYASGFSYPPEYHQMHKQNKWNAVRHGLDGDFLEVDGVVSIREKAHQLAEMLDKNGSFKGFCESGDISDLHDLIESESIASRMRRVYNESRDFKKVIAEEIIR